MTSERQFLVDVNIKGHSVIYYDRKVMRRAQTRGAADIRKEARRLLSRRAISAPGEIPGMQTGALKRAIGIVSRGTNGGWVKVGVRKIDGSKFYPAFLYYGSEKTGLKKRANFMQMALDNRREAVKSVISSALKDSLVSK